MFIEAGTAPCSKSLFLVLLRNNVEFIVMLAHCTNARSSGTDGSIKSTVGTLDCHLSHANQSLSVRAPPFRSRLTILCADSRTRLKWIAAQPSNLGPGDCKLRHVLKSLFFSDFADDRVPAAGLAAH